MMDGQYVTKDDLEEFKKQLLQDMKNAEVELKSQNGNKLLLSVYHNWIYDPSSSYRFKTPFHNTFETKQTYRIWDAVRKVVCAVCGVTTVAGIPIKKQEFAIDFCDKLCEFIYEYMKKHGGEHDGQGGTEGAV